MRSAISLSFREILVVEAFRFHLGDGDCLFLLFAEFPVELLVADLFGYGVVACLVYLEDGAALGDI